MSMHEDTMACVPMRMVGPVKFSGGELKDEIMVPLATFETPLWPSVNRGAKVTRLAGGVNGVVISDFMTRSIVMRGVNASEVAQIATELKLKFDDVSAIVASTSRYASLCDYQIEIVGNLMYFRLVIKSGDASGHNMVTAAAEAVQNWILQQYKQLKYVSISANCCTDKKVSAINGILGRGKYVVADIRVPANVCQDVLKTTPEKIVDLHIKKNLIGSNVAGSIRSANAHFANMLLGFYLATGQDVANIVEGSQGMVHCEVDAGDLYFSVTIPNIIVGTVGNGKDLDFAYNNLKAMGCTQERDKGMNSRRLAIICAGVVLCGEISLLAAQTNPGELMRTHIQMERSSATEAV